MEYTEKTRGHFIPKNIDGKYNEYYCEDCESSGIKHSVETNVPHGYTDETSSWGSGLATTRRECSVCHKWDGPWLTTD